MDFLGKKQLSYYLENRYKENNYPTVQSIDFCCLLHAKKFLCYAFCLHVSINMCISAEFKCLLLETFNSRDQNTYTQVNEFCLSCHNQFFKWAINWQKHHIPQSWVAKDLTISLQKHSNIWDTNSNAACTQNEEKNQFSCIYILSDKK